MLSHTTFAGRSVLRCPTSAYLYKLASALYSTAGSPDSSSKKPFPVELIRNFNIIAHIDHGKSTLADRLLELTGKKISGAQQYLDGLKVERERGITVKAKTATMLYDKYLLNLIDTPGHVDFHYEVSRSMRCCSGSLLIVDATQGIQAQTVANYELAFLQNLTIIPIINKIDAQGANVDDVKASIIENFGFSSEEIHLISARTGQGVAALLPEIVQKLPPPQVEEGEAINTFKGFLVNSWFAKDLGVILVLQLRGGVLKRGDQIISCHYQRIYDVFEVGFLTPEMQAEDFVSAGQVAYVITNMKAVKEARVGDTFYRNGERHLVQAEVGFQEAKPMVFAGLYPSDAEQYQELEKNIEKLAITDPAVTVERETSAALGNGFRCGFLGLLHMDVFKQRLDDEFSVQAFLTTPSVQYRARLRHPKNKGEIDIVDINNAAQAPDPGLVQYYEEPIADVTLIFPKENLQQMLQLCYERRGEQKEMTLIQEKRYKLRFIFPLSEIITDFFDQVKGLTHGYGSLDYELCGFRKAKISKLVIVIMDDEIDSLSFMVHQERAQELGRQIIEKLKANIAPQLFQVSIKAKVGGRILASEEIRAVRKNVTAKCYGGDYSRKKKLLENQKEGKKRMRQLGSVEVPQSTFIDILKK